MVTPFSILDLRFLVTPFSILDLRFMVTPFSILDLRFLVTPLVSYIYGFWLPLWYLRFTIYGYPL